MTKPRVFTALIGATPATALAQTEARYFMPEGASNHADHVDFAMHFINGVTVFFFVLIIALMLFFAVRYRRRSPHDRAASQKSHNTALELSWSLPPAVIVIFMFYLGFQGFMTFDRAPADAYEITVTANTWDWTFTHPNGYQSGNLHVPEGQPVRLVMNSRDVIHSLYVPVFRVKQDVVPGRYTDLWFEARGTTPGADEPLPEGEELDQLLREDIRESVEARREREAEQEAEGDENGEGDNGDGGQPEGSAAGELAQAQAENGQDPAGNGEAEDDGDAEYEDLTVEEEVEQRLEEMSESEKRNRAMLLRMERISSEGHVLYCAEYCGTNHSDMMARVVVHPSDWEAPDPVRPEDPVEWGEQLFVTQGCAGCHQVPGAEPSGVAAPSFEDGIYEQERQMTDGTTLTADRDYLRRSILDPMADVREGYPPAMPPGLVTDDDELDAIIEYLVSLD